MRDDPVLLRLLACPSCRTDLRIQEQTEVSADGHILKGQLQCVGCGAKYPIRGGVPRFVPALLADDVCKTIDGFSYQWHHANARVKNTRFDAADTFLNFISPVQPQYFKGKVILDAGCGAGRFTCWAQQFGATAVVGADLSNSVEIAFENTRDLQNVLIIQADLFSMPLRQCFDYAFSIGVLHHTADPRRAFAAMVAVVKPAGGVSAWVYGKEGNGWVIHLLNPIRLHLTSRLPRWLLLALAYAIAVPLFLVLKGIYAPVGRIKVLAPLKTGLFYFEYLLFLSGFGLHEQAYVVFDHLVPTIAAYISRDEFADWFGENQLEQVLITSRAGNSWRGFGIRPA